VRDTAGSREQAAAVPARRLVTTVSPGRGDDRRWTSTAAHLALETDDGRRVTLLDDRGWASTAPPAEKWASRADVEETARTVVGPDEPPDGVTPAQEDAAHREHLAAVAAAAGVVVTADELAALPHDVVLHPDVERWVVR
jgi:hypothetical protein